MGDTAAEEVQMPGSGGAGGEVGGGADMLEDWKNSSPMSSGAM